MGPGAGAGARAGLGRPRPAAKGAERAGAEGTRRSPGRPAPRPAAPAPAIPGTGNHSCNFTENHSAASRESNPEVRGSHRRDEEGTRDEGPRRKFGHFPEVVRGKVGERPGDAGMRVAKRGPGPGTGGSRH